MSALLDSLNDKQQQAVSAPLCNVLVLAGAGSGKTRVLVHRLAWLCTQHSASPQQIMAVTFTNKAAAEIRHRLESQFHLESRGLWVGTFHGLAHRLLRMHFQEAGLPEQFQILDSDDQYRLVRRCIKNLGIDEKQWPARQAQHFINHQKDRAKRPQHIQAEDYHTEMMLKIYQHYQQLCQQNGVVDFAELLLATYELWQQHPDILALYQKRFQHLLVDEFQDTNTIQYLWIKLLTNANTMHVMAVGDDDQSIYGWRGAQVDNIHHFQNDFAPVETIRLEQNYRSTQTILRAANAVIEHNSDRLGKDLWSAGEEGEPIHIYQAFNELEEAKFIVAQIEQQCLQGRARSDIAILYRSNAQSRVLEEALIQAGIPYRVYGGMRFFERAEIKTALAYLRLINNPLDNDAFERIINTPTRGIGERTVEAIRQHAQGAERSLWQATQALLDARTLNGRAHTAVQKFVDLIAELKSTIDDEPLEVQVQRAIEGSGLITHYQQEPGEKGQARVENLGELITAAKQFTPPDMEGNLSPLALFLAHASLEAGEGQADAFEDSVQLMTLHSAKGLEFPVVFIAGMEEQLFPSAQSLNQPDRLEEERRLCYVGITRAMQHLFLTHAECRRQYGDNQIHTASRFIREIPEELVHEVRPKAHIRQPAMFGGRQQVFRSSAPICEAAGQQWYVGQGVAHAKFGQGVILNFENPGPNARLQIRFANGEVKWLVAAYAKLEAV